MFTLWLFWKKKKIVDYPSLLLCEVLSRTGVALYEHALELQYGKLSGFCYHMAKIKRADRKKHWDKLKGENPDMPFEQFTKLFDKTYQQTNEPE